MYDSNNIFAKIMRNEIPVKKIFEDEKLIAINDIAPQAPVHILIIPKGEYLDMADFVKKASADDIHHFFNKTTEIAKKHCENNNYRIIINKGPEAGQSIFHCHLHILGGKKLTESMGN